MILKEFKDSAVKLYVLLNIFKMINTIPQTQCTRIKIADKWYEKEILWTPLGRAYNLNVLRSTNSLFFSFTVSESYSEVDFQIGHYNIDLKEYHSIAGINSGCAIAIDQDKEEVYLGGRDGIYKYNMLTKIADLYGEKGKNIWALFFRRNLFYVKFPSEKLYIEFNGKFSQVKEFETFYVDIFYVTNKNDIYFTNRTGLYKFDSRMKKHELINELYVIRQISEDNDGKLYLCTSVGIFTDSAEGFQKAVDDRNIYGLAFDKDNNMIYSDEKNIVRFKHVESGCNETTNW